MLNPRQIAYEALIKIEKEGAYSNIALDFLLSKSISDTRDRSFVSNLFYGVIERKLTLDYQLGLYLSKPLNKLKTEVLTILRMGAYQILFMDKVPSSAAVNESVKISRKNGLSFASGLINAVLRKIAENGLKLPSEDNKSDYMSVKYSCPQWLINKWIKEYGIENTTGILESSLGASDNYIKINHLITDEEKLIRALNDEGIGCERTSIDGCFKINLHSNPVERLDSFQKGFFHIQDAACQLCVKALKAKTGERIFDLCAAPGGKSYSIAEEIGDIGEVLSFDIHEHRVSLIKNGAERLGLSSVKALVGDATVYNKELGEADAVLCDVPCSGFGIIGRKPEIKYKDPDEVKKLPELQLSILLNGAKYVKKGGRLVYSTCTLSQSENQKVCKRFLDKNESFVAIKPLEGYSDETYITLMPHTDKTDGFFIACFERVK